MIENLEVMQAKQIEHRVHELSDGGYRFVTITCCNNQDGTFDLLYSFDKDHTLLNLKTTVSSDEPVQSISNIYIAASFAENEIRELFGLTVEGIAIDYGGRFILPEGAPESPFGSGIIIEKLNKEAAADAK